MIEKGCWGAQWKRIWIFFSLPNSVALIPWGWILLESGPSLSHITVSGCLPQWHLTCVFDWAGIWEVTQLSIFIKSIAQSEEFLIVTRGCVLFSADLPQHTQMVPWTSEASRACICPLHWILALNIFSGTAGLTSTASNTFVIMVNTDEANPPFLFWQASTVLTLY